MRCRDLRARPWQAREHNAHVLTQRRLPLVGSTLTRGWEHGHPLRCFEAEQRITVVALDVQLAGAVLLEHLLEGHRVPGDVAHQQLGQRLQTPTIGDEQRGL